MEEKYNGEERRTDNTSVRLALLERSYFENRDSNVAIHKRITETRKEISEIKENVAAEIRTGLESLFTNLAKQQERCAKHEARTATVENTVKWLDRWLVTTWAAIMTAAGFLLHKGKTG